MCLSQKIQDCCSLVVEFVAITLKIETEIVPLLSCNKDVNNHKFTDKLKELS